MNSPVLFIFYTTPLTWIIEKHSIRHEMFADDTQLSHSESPENYSGLVRSLQDCVKDTGLWMEENKLQLNNDKTEKLFVSPPPPLSTRPCHTHRQSLSAIPMSSYGWVHFSRAVLFCQHHQQLFTHSSDRQTDRQAGRQAGRQTNRQTDRQAGGRAGRQAGRQTDRQAGGRAGRQVGR